MKKRLKVLVLFDGTSPTTVDQDFSDELKTKEWKTEADVMNALGTLGHAPEHLAIYDDVDLLRQKLETFAPDVLFNLVEQFRNKSEFDQNIVSFLEMQGLPFTGCGSTGLTLCKHKGISKKILHYHGIHVPNFMVIPRGQRIARLKQPKFPLIVKPVKEEASYGISQASFVGNDEQFRERVSFIHEKHNSDAIAEEYIDELMRSLVNAPPVHTPEYRVADYDCLNVKLKTYYARKRKLNEESYPDFYDADLRQLFAAPAGIKAGAYLRRRRRRLLNAVCQWTNEKKFPVNQLLTRLTSRCDELGLHVLNDDPQQDFRVTAFITTLVMNYLFTGKFKRTK